MPVRNDAEVLKTTDVAVLFGVSARTIDEWRRASLIPFFTTPKGWARYRRSELEPYLQSRPGQPRRVSE